MDSLFRGEISDFQKLDTCGVFQWVPNMTESETMGLGLGLLSKTHTQTFQVILSVLNS